MKLIVTLSTFTFIAVGDAVIKVSIDSDIVTKYTCSSIPTNHQSEQQGAVSTLVGIEVSICGSYLFGMYSSKLICCWDVKSESVMGHAVLPKKCSSIVYKAVDDTKGMLVLSDKFGDIWALNAPTLSKKVLVGGHTASVVTDMVTTTIATTSYLATSDRDEKIRITRFPNLLQIQTYCLGHKSVITSISFLNINSDASGDKSHLVSCGWDNAICLWDPVTGLLLDKYVEVVAAATPSNTNEVEEVAVDDAAVEEIAVEDGDNDMETDKVYDESKAGNYTLKIATYLNVVAVMYSGLKCVKVYHIIDLKVVYFSTIVTDEVPVDIEFNVFGRLSILLPKPFNVSIYDISYNASNSSNILNIISLSELASDKLKAILTAANADHRQQSVLGASDDQGLTKTSKKMTYDWKCTIERKKNKSNKKIKVDDTTTSSS